MMLAPALEQIGVPTIAAHLFVFYYGVVSFITPPVCMAAFAAAGIAGSPPMKTSFYSMRLGIGAYLLPFAFSTMPGILLIGTAGDIASSILFMLISIIAVVVGFEGYLFHAITWWERTVLIVSGILVIAPQEGVRFIALALILGTFARQVIVWLRLRHSTKEAEVLREGAITAD